MFDTTVHLRYLLVIEKAGVPVFDHSQNFRNLLFSDRRLYGCPEGPLGFDRRIDFVAHPRLQSAVGKSDIAIPSYLSKFKANAVNCPVRQVTPNRTLEF